MTKAIAFEKIAFYYGNPPIPQKLFFFPAIVVDPDSGLNPKMVENASRLIYAYVSAGEVDKHNQYAKEIPTSWLIGKNKIWDSTLPDQSNPKWREFFITKVIAPLWEKGYHGFFLDTLDSYHLVSSDPNVLKKQKEGLIALIQDIKTRYPTAHLIFNRGFELLPHLNFLPDEVVAESLFTGWDNQKKRYYLIDKKQRDMLIHELNEVKKRGVSVTVIDYLPKEKAKEAPIFAEKIAALGFNPWITDGLLKEIYLFPNQTSVPRKILLIYQANPKFQEKKLTSVAARMLSFPLNHLGYVTELRNIVEPLKKLNEQEYAGVVVNISGGSEQRKQELYDWYKYLQKKKIPLVIFDEFGFGFDRDKLRDFGLERSAYPPKKIGKINIHYRDSMIGYEAEPYMNKAMMMPIKLTNGKALLTFSTDKFKFDIAGITPWGGYFLTQSFLEPTLNENYRWTINPFLFLKEALKLPDRPIPDTTTENGMRLMMIHIDGDGFANRGEWYNAPFSGEIMLHELFERYRIPTTVSIIQGEIAKNGLYPQYSNKLEDIARTIFKLPHVEVASHTYGHPFSWDAAFNYKGPLPNPEMLNIPQYHLNLETEIKGSVAYINQNLTTPDKPCKVFLWSGAGDVPEKALDYTYQLGIANLNPGLIMTNRDHTITRASPLGLFSGPWFQVFAPIGNDRETQTAERLFYSLISIKSALELTENPVRLEPIDIYFHFYTVGQPGGIKALKLVYDWALSQEVLNIFASEFFNIATDFNHLRIIKQGDGWLYITQGFLKELRIPKSSGYPDLQNSKNVVGYRFHNDDCYIHLGPQFQSFVKLTKTPPKLPYLSYLNAHLTRFERKGKEIEFAFRGHLAPQFAFKNMAGCELFQAKNKIEPMTQTSDEKKYAFKEGLAHELTIKCE